MFAGLVFFMFSVPILAQTPGGDGDGLPDSGPHAVCYITPTMNLSRRPRPVCKHRRHLVHSCMLVMMSVPFCGDIVFQQYLM